MADTTAPAGPGPILVSPEDRKADIRMKVWNYLGDNRLVNFPFPPHHRISNFKGAETAGDLVVTLDVFKNAKCIKVDPDKPLQQVRFRAIEAGKTLLVPTPRLRSGLFNRITPPADGGTSALKACATRQGVDEYSVPIGLDDTIHVDLIVVGCVAVSPKGWRIGKGAGFSDMEYAMMVSTGAVDSTVPVVTIVHDCQVLDMPDSIFEQHDLPVDYIVTPTRVIQCDGASTKRPSGMIWSLLTSERLTKIPVLACLRYREWKAGKDVRLNGETEAPTDVVDGVLPAEDDQGESPPRRINRRRPAKRSTQQTEKQEGDKINDDGKVNGVIDYKKDPDKTRPRIGRGGRRVRQFARRPAENGRMSESDKDAANERSDGENRGERTRGTGARRFRRGTGRRVGSGRGRGGTRSADDADGRDDEKRGGGRGGRRDHLSESDGDVSGGNDSQNKKRRPFRPGYRRRFLDDCEGSVYVGALPRTVRVSEFKAEVRDRDVQPLRVVWRGGSGFAFLNFRTIEDAEHALTALEGLHISDRSLRLEMAKSNNPPGRRRRQASASRSDGGGDDGAQSDEA